MNSWRDAVLKEFVPNISKLTLVADPDSLLTEEKLSLQLRERGFDLIEFNDPIEFRYEYESRYRSVWDNGEPTDLVVILRLENTELGFLPYDLWQSGRKLAFNLSEIFPNLSYPVIQQLDRGLLDALYEAQCISPPDRMGDNSTKDYILRHVFGIAAEMLTNEVELLHVLLRLHYGNVTLPMMLAERFINVLAAKHSFIKWPLSTIIIDPEEFFIFLQERWPIFLSKLGTTSQPKDVSLAYGLKIEGPTLLPFDHQDIKIYIDNLFLDGKLTPIECNNVEIGSQSWIRSGILLANADDLYNQISRLMEIVTKEIPSIDSRYPAWISYEYKWAKLSSLVHSSNNADYHARLIEIGNRINASFYLWLEKNYASLIYMPPVQPAMLHHLIRHIARSMEDSPQKRAALIVVDGLSLDQWLSIRPILEKQSTNVMLRESAAFAWIPTLTSVSRQAIFSGKPPHYFPSSINSTNNEEKLWRQFWEDQGLSRFDIAYQRGLGDGDASLIIESILHPNQTKVVGLVVDKVDKIMHGMQLGAAGMHNQIEQWCQGGFLSTLIDRLLNFGFDVWLTSDHGNVQCSGKGRPLEGVIAETRGERVRVYPTMELREHVAQDYPFAQKWQSVGLPAEYYPLLTSGYDAFINPEESIVGHGGATMEEVIVPLIKIERKS